MMNGQRYVPLLPLIVLALLWSAADAVQAQTTSSSGLFGTQSFGSSLSGQSSTRISGSSRSGSLGSSRLGSSGLSTMSSGQFLNFQSVNQAEQFFGSSSFVGADSADVVNPLSVMLGSSGSRLSSGLTGRTTTGLLGRTTLGSSLLGRSSRGYSQSRSSSLYGSRGRTQRDVIRASVRVGFSPPAEGNRVNSEAITTELATRLSRISGLQNAPQAADVQVNLEGRTAVLKGTVPTADARLVLERLLLLEPGVDKVQNELVVAGSNP